MKKSYYETTAWKKITEIFDWSPSFNLIIVGLPMGEDAYGYPGNVDEIISFPVESDFTVDAIEVLYTEQEMEEIYEEALKALVKYATSLSTFYHKDCNCGR